MTPTIEPTNEPTKAPTEEPTKEPLSGRPLEELAAVRGPALPPWPQHCFGLLQGLRQLPAKFAGGKLRIQVWSDCGGMGTELFALKEIREMLKTENGFELIVCPYAYCDCDKQALAFAELNHTYCHVADNIRDRDFDKVATYNCLKCHKCHFMPTGGIDLYVCCFPCGPWSARGNGCGFEHHDGDICWTALKTIKRMRPCAFLMENVLRLDTPSPGNDDPSLTDLGAIQKHLKDELGGDYELVIVRGIDPPMAGFPIHKKRLVILGCRVDPDNRGISPRVLRESIESLMQTPLRPSFSWRQFLGRECTIDWSRAWEMQSPEERLMQLKECTCTLDPYIVCPRHPCRCGKCGTDLVGCAWRRLHQTFIKDKFCSCYNGRSYDELILDKSHRLSYIALIEKSGRSAPSSPRERNLLNVTSLLPELHPLGSTPSILDISQSLKRGGLRIDGYVGTMATNAVMWSMIDANVLNIGEMFKLMGHREVLSRDSLKRKQLKTLLGMSLHVGTAGLLISSILASIRA